MTVFVPNMAGLSRDSTPVRTLVVDDSVVVRTVIERILNGDPGFSVVHKTNSAEHALHYLADHKVDLILLDIELPGHRLMWQSQGNGKRHDQPFRQPAPGHRHR